VVPHSAAVLNDRPKLPPGVQAQEELEPYGRTEEEKKIDRELLAEKYFDEHELETLAVRYVI
jgi:hypothetical protein